MFGTLIQWFLALEPIAKAVIESAPNSGLSSAIKTISDDAAPAVSLLKSVGGVLSNSSSPSWAPVISEVVNVLAANNESAKSALHVAATIVDGVDSQQAVAFIKVALLQVFPGQISLISPIADAIAVSPEASRAAIKLITSGIRSGVGIVSASPMQANPVKDPNNPDN